MHGEECLIYNDYLERQNITENECYACIDFTTEKGRLDHLNNVSASITDSYLYGDWPFIVTDATRDWPRDENGNHMFSVENIKKVFIYVWYLYFRPISNFRLMLVNILNYFI